MNAAARQPVRTWSPKLTGATTFLAVGVALGVSAMTLTAMGIGYDSAGGSPLSKVHPSTWLFALAFGLNIIAKPRPLTYLASLPRAFPGAAWFVVGWVFIVLYAHVVQQAAVMPLLDTFFAAVALLALYPDLDEATQVRMLWLVHAILFVNGCLGIAEFVLHFRLTPFVVGEVPIVNDMRSTALLGHPLLNAGTTGAYILMLFFGGHPGNRPGLRATMIGLQMLAMIAFGGRTAIVLGIAIMALGSLPAAAAVLAGRRFDQRIGLMIAIGLPVLIGLGVLAISEGFFTTLIERFVDDKGSAEARVVIWDLFGRFTLEELLLGPDPDRLAGLQFTFGIEYGIENSWLGFVFQYGLLPTILFLTGFFALLADYIRRSRPHSLIIIAYFLGLASSSASLSVKSLVFTQFGVVMLIIFVRPRVVEDGRLAFAATTTVL